MAVHYLVGGAGIPNYGDELIALAWIDFIGSRRPDDKIILDVQDRAATQAMFGSRPNVEYVSLLKRISSKNATDNIWNNIEQGSKFIDLGGLSRHKEASVFQEALKDITTFHVFGGGYINKRWPSAGFYLGLGAAISKFSGAKAVATGLGLMPIVPPKSQNDVDILVRVLDNYEFIETRDSESADALSASKVIFGLDDAFMTPPLLVSKTQPRTLHIAVTFGDSEAFAPLINHVANVWAPQFERVLFWNCAPAKDIYALFAFSRALPEMRVIDAYHLVHRGLVFSPSDAMIATRFHPHLMAARAGISGLYLFRNSYYEVKHGSLISLGSSFSKVSLHDLPTVFTPSTNAMQQSDANNVEKKLALATSVYSVK